MCSQCRAHAWCPPDCTFTYLSAGVNPRAPGDVGRPNGEGVLPCGPLRLSSDGWRPSEVFVLAGQSARRSGKYGSRCGPLDAGAVAATLGVAARGDVRRRRGGAGHFGAGGVAVDTGAPVRPVGAVDPVRLRADPAFPPVRATDRAVPDDAQHVRTAVHRPVGAEPV